MIIIKIKKIAKRSRCMLYIYKNIIKLKELLNKIIFFCYCIRIYSVRITSHIYSKYFFAEIFNSYINRRITNEIEQLATPDNKIPGSSVNKGYLYHDFAFPDRFKFNAHRNNSIIRLKKIKNHIPIKNTRILDLGCSNGALSLPFGLLGATKVIGIDYDKQAIRVANAMKDKYKIKNVNFINQKIEPNNLNLPEVDTIIWLSNWMWLVKEYGLETGLDMLYNIPYKTRAEFMVFESAADDGQAAIKNISQKDIESFLKLNTPYQKIKNIGPFRDKWRAKGKERLVFICSEPKMIYKGKGSVIRRINRNTVRKTFDNQTLWAMENEIKCLKRLKKFKYFPTIKKIGSNWYETNYCGEPITKINQLKNIRTIVNILKQNNICHRDINPLNILELNGQLSLIDFGWAVIDKKEPQDSIPKGLGRGYYDSNNFDDLIAVENLIKKWSKNN